MSRESIGSRRLPRPSTAFSASSEDTVATTAEIVERATSTLQGLRTADALQIWRALGLYVQDQLAQRRPVRVDQFGVFGLNESVEPVFLADVAFLQTNRLRERERNGQVLSTRFAPAARVNAQQIGTQYLPKCRKEVVVAVLANVVALVGKWTKQGRRRGIRLGFLPVGEWQCDSDGVVSFRFLAEFRKHLRLGMTAVTAAQAVGPISCSGGDDGGEPGSKPDSSSRAGSSVVPSTAGANSTSSKRVASASGSRPGIGRTHKTSSLCESQSSIRDAKYVTALDHSSGPKSARSMPASASSRRSEAGKIGARANTVRLSTSATSIVASSSSKKTTSFSRLACAEPRVDETAIAILAQMRTKLARRCGFSGLNALERALRSMVHGDGFLTRRELKFGLRDIGVEINASELDGIMDAMTNDRENGRFRVDAVMVALRGAAPLPDSRHALIERAFRLMDVSRCGVVTVDDMKDNYDASALPKVRTGKQSAEQAMAAFLREWEPDVVDNNAINSDKKTKRCTTGGGISLGSFVRYYHNVSACVADDKEFERMMRQLWHVSPDQDDEGGLEDGDCASPLEEDNNSNEDESGGIRERQRLRSKSPTQSFIPDNQQADEAWQYLEALLLPKKWSRGVTQVPSLDEMCRRIGANRVLGDGNEAINTRAFGHALTHLDKQLETKKAKYLASLAASTGPSQVEQGGSGVIYLAELYKALTNTSVRENRRPASNSNGNRGKSSQVIDKVRQRLLRRVALSSSSADDTSNNGNASPTSEFDPASVTFHGLARSLRLMDTDGDRRLSKDELKTGLRKFGVDINFHEVDCLFALFDTDQSGCISCDEFVAGMRGEMNERRLALVQRAFGLLDADGDGQVTLKELQAAYDCSKHPEVISGKISAEDAIRIFASQWETNQPDGVITRSEFETYYKNLSASIDSDDYFELTMRNAWHISGGEGQCANATNRRVQLTDADGLERVVEIRNDLGIKSTDFARMRANLEAQGLLRGPGTQNDKAAEIQLHTYSDHRDKRDFARAVQSAGGNNAREKTRNLPDRRFHRRSQFAPPASGGRSFLAMADTNRDALHHDRETQHALRDRAAELIQSRFRGFRARKLVALVRRKMAAEHQRRTSLEKEQAAGKRRVLRAATRTVHGF